MKRKQISNGYKQDVSTWQSNFITKKPGEWDDIPMLVLVAQKLVFEHRFTDDFTYFILSILKDAEHLPLLLDLYALLNDDLTNRQRLKDDLEESLGCTDNPSLPDKRDVQTLFYLINYSEKETEARERIRQSLADEESEIALSQSRALDQFKHLSRVFNLDQDETSILIALYTMHTYDPLYDVINQWKTSECIRGLSLIIGIETDTCRQKLGPQSTLQKFELIESELTRQGEFFSLKEAVKNFISFAGSRSIHETMLEIETSQPFPLESFSIETLRQNTVIALLNGNKPSHILLYGKEGSGKTEFAKALAQQTEKKLYKYHQGKQSHEYHDDLFNLSLITTSTDSDNAIILIDEADDLLSTSPSGFFSFLGTGAKSSKSRLNDILDNAKCSIIWIVNRVQQIDASTRRRFSFSVEFKSLAPSAIQNLAREYLSDLNISETLKESIVSLSGNYGLPASSIRYLHDTISAILEQQDSLNPDTDDLILARVRLLFESNTRLLTGTLPLRIQTGPSYSIDALNITVAPERIIGAVKRALERIENIALDGDVSIKKGLRFLFHGDSGTGKTELARHIAAELGKPLLIKRASDILSPWVGVAEQNVASVFLEAEESNSILLIDEADSFFYNREKATRSWERTLVNEFLTRMEEFEGILICTTNAPDVLDKAVSRRFHEIVEFQSLTTDGIETLLARYYPDLTFTENHLLDLFMQGTLTPGDFGSLKGRTNYLDEGEVTASYIVESLVEINQMRQREVAC
ncbi:MAG TPA: AAA family ATPase [Treponemataceae bacterium]|nr:AAA family ATPase [Treponemataceae bacterium]